MSIRLEQDEEHRFVKWLTQNGIEWLQKRPGDLLDRWLLIKGGRPFVVEFKRRHPKGQLSKRQMSKLLKLRESGYDIEVHDNAQEAITAVKIRLEAQSLHEKGRGADAEKLIARSIARSRIREDFYKPSGWEGAAD